jgi:hypothetical protein
MMGSQVQNLRLVPGALFICDAHGQHRPFLDTMANGLEFGELRVSGVDPAQLGPDTCDRLVKALVNFVRCSDLMFGSLTWYVCPAKILVA